MKLMQDSVFVRTRLPHKQANTRRQDKTKLDDFALFRAAIFLAGSNQKYSMDDTYATSQLTRTSQWDARPQGNKKYTMEDIYTTSRLARTSNGTRSSGTTLHT
eukprot:GEMP01060491.1.p1 GENE.GEMP01060491.1~~GEMP01060491.1.p1  ORF type:complete len:103 (-),score=7.33 GEMP01060491.1:824-1132(-)